VDICFEVFSDAWEGNLAIYLGLLYLGVLWPGLSANGGLISVISALKWPLECL
jgi:hypothetical protein